MLEEISIQLLDIEDIRQTLAACLNYFTAQDVARAQQACRPIRPSALTENIEKVADRVNGYLGDFLIAKHEAEHEAEHEGELEETELEPEEDDWEPNPNPLGSRVPQSRVARVVEDIEV